MHTTRSFLGVFEGRLLKGTRSVMLDMMRAGEREGIEIERDNLSDKEAIEDEQMSPEGYKRDGCDYDQDNLRWKYT